LYLVNNLEFYCPSFPTAQLIKDNQQASLIELEE